MLTWAQVEPALPKVGQAAQLDSCAQSEGHMKEIRANPGQVLLQRSKWPARVKHARSMIQNNEEWDKLCTGVWSSGVIQPMDDSEVIRDQHAIPLAGGLFGICKGKFIQDAPAQRLQEVLGLICNIPPRNAVQIKVEGDVEGLPYEGNWQFMFVGNESILLWHSGDMVGSFWLFLLPKERGTLFMISKLARGSIVGPAADLVPIWLTGMPLGWTSVAGIVQCLHSRLVKLSDFVPRHLELRRAGPVPTDRDFNVNEFYKVYANNLDEGESATGGPARCWLATQLSDLQRWILTLRSTGQQLSVICAEDEKWVHGASLGQTLDAEIDDRKEEIRPPVPRPPELLGLTFWRRSRRQVISKDLEVLCGGWLNIFQFRRQITESWDLRLDPFFEFTRGDDRWSTAFDQHLPLMVLAPMAVNKLNHDADHVVPASDASGQRAGVVAGGGLTSSGFARLAEAGAALERHESTATTLTKFPTSLRSVPKKRPPLEPPGPDTCSAWELHQWENQCFRFSPYQFRKHNMVLDRRSGCWNPPSSRTPELLMVFQANATCLSGGGAGKKQDADASKDIRQSLLDDAMHVGVVAVLPSAPLTLSQLAFPEPSTRRHAEERLVKAYLARQGHRGTEIRVEAGPERSRTKLGRQELPTSSWRWMDMISAAWHLPGEHVNTLERRALTLAPRWRAKSVKHRHKKFIHLRDSMVSHATLTRHRSTARSRSYVVMRGVRASTGCRLSSCSCLHQASPQASRQKLPEGPPNHQSLLRDLHKASVHRGHR